jgi:hypothetical protein
LRVSDVNRSDATRVLCVYDLAPRVRAESSTSLAELYDYGRFQGHVEASAQLLPRVIGRRTIAAGELAVAGDESPAERLGGAVAQLLVTPRCDPLLVLDVPLPGQAGLGEVLWFLAASCFRRDLLTVAGQPVLQWLQAEFESPAPLRFGRNIHQLVLAGGDLAEQLLLESASDQQPIPQATSIVYRGTISADRGRQLGVRLPPALNNPGETLLAHGRGVSLLAGWGGHVEQVLLLAATNLVSAMGVLYRTRALAFHALERNQSARLGTLDDAGSWSRSCPAR